MKGSKAALEALAKVRKICGELPDFVEKEAWRAPTFRTAGRMFAMFVDGRHADARIAVWCNPPPDAQRIAVHDDPETFFVPPYVGPGGGIIP